jgi:hypothetical protein
MKESWFSMSQRRPPHTQLAPVYAGCDGESRMAMSCAMPRLLFKQDREICRGDAFQDKFNW